MKIKKGEWYRIEGPDLVGYAYRSTQDTDNNQHIRVIVRDAKPRVRIKLSEELAWLHSQQFWSIEGESGSQWRVRAGGDTQMADTLAKAIYRLRRFRERCPGT